MKKIVNKLSKHEKFRKFERWFLLFFWLAAIYFLSSKQNLGFDSHTMAEFILRKIAHVFEFGVLTFFIYRILHVTEKRKFYKNLFWAIVFAILYAASDEYHQSLVIGRTGTYKDVIIDSVGVFIAGWLILLNHIYPMVKHKISNKQEEGILDFIWKV